MNTPDQDSGAYIFRTSTKDNEWSSIWRNIVDVKTYSGKVVNLTSIQGDTVDTIFMSRKTSTSLILDVLSNVKALPTD